MLPELLIVTNGNRSTWPGIEYGAWLGATTKTPLTLLGVDETEVSQIDNETLPIEPVYSQAVSLLEQRGAGYRLEVEHGHTEEILPRKTKEREFLTVLAPLGRPALRRFFLGRSFRHIMAEISSPLIYVPEARIPLKRMLICIGGLGYEVTAEDIAIRIALMVHAEVTLLNVVPPIDLDYPTARLVRKNWSHLADTDTPLGRSLRQGLDIARAAGLTASVKVRNGNVVDELVDEITRENYDLACMGSTYSAHSLRQMYSPNVTAEVAEAAHCPILTARYQVGMST
jgi:nucleotide-binding universal stress UspA family protein